MPVVTYSLLRLGLFVGALVGLWLAGLGGWLLVVVATVVAFVLAYVLLGRQRNAAAQWLAARRAAPDPRPRFSRAVRDDAAHEDAAADRLRAGDGSGGPGRERGPDGAEGPDGADGPDGAEGPDGERGQTARPSPSSTP